MIEEGNSEDQQKLVRQMAKEAKNYYATSYSAVYEYWKRRRSIVQSFRHELMKLITTRRTISILEIGCDNGRLLFHLNDYSTENHSLQFCGIDLAYSPIFFATQVKNNFNTPNMFFGVGDAEKLNFKSGVFDIVICSDVLEHLITPEVAILEMLRVLRKDGLAIITVPIPGDGRVKQIGKIINYFLLGKLKRNMIKTQEKMINVGEVPERLRKGQRTEGIGYGHISEKSPKEWISEFQKAGFSVERLKRSSNFFYGSPFWDNHQVFMGLILILNTIFDSIPGVYDWSLGILIEARKK